MGKGLLDEMIFRASGLSTLEEAVRNSTVASAIYDMQREAAKILELSGAAAMQRQLEEVAHLGALAYPKVTEIERALEDSLLAEKSLVLASSQHFDTLQEMVKVEDSTARLIRDMVTPAADRFRDDIKTLTDRFRLPYDDEATRVYDLVRDQLGSRIADCFIPQQDELANLVSSLKTPWVDYRNSLESFESVARLSAVGTALLSSAYDSVASDTLKSLLGDWSHVTLPDRIFYDWRARQQFYFDYGFDKILTALPEPAFTESLHETRILRSDVFSPEVFPAETGRRKKTLRFVMQRRHDAYKLLDSLETHLREYIDEAMTALVGPDWEKHRVPTDIYEAWKRKRQEAMRKGRKEEKLINYIDFSDYVRVIERKDNWQEVFEPLFERKTNAQESFYRLQPLRIDVAHSRVVTKEDYLLVRVESHRILKAIGVLDDDGDEF